ncbi:MAG: hypothetical protein M9916_04370 [Crocinitomicaceae bacterium]|jgi:hypothetical protein|nr:hypothetical protein [Crocinitomicaceae bacterium]
MRKLRLAFGVFIVVFLLGIGNVSAQEKSTILIKIRIDSKAGYRITTVQPDYKQYELQGKGKDSEDDSAVTLKKELDKWIMKGYVIVNSANSRSNLNSFDNEIIYILVKEE